MRRMAATQQPNRFAPALTLVLNAEVLTMPSALSQIVSTFKPKGIGILEGVEVE